jgi:hypothetical protein
MKPAGENLFILKYRKRVFYDNLWSNELEYCRGTLVDKDFNLIALPFQKIYNFGIETQAPILPDDEVIDAYRKINGFMVTISWHNNDLLISTTGSTSGDYIDMARELIDVEKYRAVCAQWHRTTFMFECVHRNDPHIIPEQEGMYLLGYRETNWESKVIINPKIRKMLSIDFGARPVEHFRTTVGELKDIVKTVKHEGFVFYNDSGVSAKIKSPFYLTSKWVARNPRTDRLVNLKNDIKKNIDEEFHGLIDKIRENIVEYTAMNEQERLQWVRAVFGVES